MQRIVIFTGSLDYSVRKGVAELTTRFPNTQFLIVLHKPMKKWKTLARNQWKNLKRNGWRWIAYQSSEILDIIANRKSNTHWHSPVRPGDQYDSSFLFDGDRVTLATTEDIHSIDTVAHIKNFAPDLGLSLAAPILKPRLFAIPRLGTLNLHKGKLPDYRGMPAAFWESLNDEPAVGCTIHFINKGLDTGDVLLESEVQRQRFSTVRGLQLSLDELGVRLMGDAVELVARGANTPRAQPSGGKTYTKPTLKQKAAMERKERHLNSTDSQARRIVKECLASTYIHAYRPLTRRLRSLRSSHQDVIVLLYHRVNDELRDSVTVGIEQFDHQMAFLARHYPIASIEDVVHDRIPLTRLHRPAVVVTFDDGYLDNYVNAVPILLRHGIPAAFFVSTGMIGKARGFEHDLKKLGRALPNMEWGHLREMRNCGFTIGSHSASHTNCSEITESQLEKELSQSRDQLRAELGLDEIYFAYPYGHQTDLPPERLEMVKKAGYAACLSAYGGINHDPVDTFNILRMGVDFNFGPKRFAARVEGW